MGSGKTTWAINYMNAHPDAHFLYITPYLPEQERIMKACPNLKFRQPEERPTKSASFHQLLKERNNIALTHSLFSILEFSEKEKELLKIHNYTLILDEVIDVVKKINVKPDDIDMLVRTEKMEIEEEGEHRVCWRDAEYDGEFVHLKRQAGNGCVVQTKHGTLLWLFPEDLLKLLSDAYVLTYMFEGSYLKPYFEIYKLKYRMAFVEKGELVYGMRDDKEKKTEIKGLMDIEQSKSRNQIGEEENALTKRWYIKQRISGNRFIPLRIAESFFHHACGARQNNAMFTVYSEVLQGIRGKHILKRFNEGQFVACNCRATNKHKDCRFLAYLINLHTDPMIDEWFCEHGKPINKDAVALSSLLQWIWRSAIRNGEKIKLYIPSWRMRKMLEGWLAGLPAGQIACTDLEEKARKLRAFKHRVVKRENEIKKTKKKIGA